MRFTWSNHSERNIFVSNDFAYRISSRMSGLFCKIDETCVGANRSSFEGVRLINGVHALFWAGSTDSPRTLRGSGRSATRGARGKRGEQNQRRVAHFMNACG